MTAQKDGDLLNPDMNRILGPNPSNANLVYILYLCSLLVGVTILAGLIMAYMNRRKADAWLQTHYTFLIRTFWIGLLYTMVGVFTLGVGVGYFILLFTFVWLIVRCTKGIRQLDNRQPVANLESWLFT